METGFDRYTPLETALNEEGFQVDEVQKQGKKTVITVSRRCGQSDEKPVFPLLTAAPTASPEKQGRPA
jgi:hypothetical protein